jgi:hypothetical protein
MPTSPRKKVTPVADWKKAPEPIELPSGKFISLSNASLSSFVVTGQIPNSLMSVITGAVNTKKGKGKQTEQETMDQILENPKALEDMFRAVDIYVCGIALDPQIHMVPENEDRDPDLLYIDEIEQADKMYIFQRGIGGTTDLETFRREFAAGVDLVQSGEDVELPPKRAARSRR